MIDVADLSAATRTFLAERAGTGPDTLARLVHEEADKHREAARTVLMGGAEGDLLELVRSAGSLLDRADELLQLAPRLHGDSALVATSSASARPDSGVAPVMNKEYLVYY